MRSGYDSQNDVFSSLFYVMKSGAAKKAGHGGYYDRSHLTSIPKRACTGDIQHS
jgi:hypothetical protein